MAFYTQIDFNRPQAKHLEDAFHAACDRLWDQAQKQSQTIAAHALKFER